MQYEVRAWISDSDMSNPLLPPFWQVLIEVCRDDGKRLSWSGERVPLDQKFGFPKAAAIASAVAEMLKDTTVLEFVGMVKG